MSDEAFERENFASILDQRGADGYAQQMRAAGDARQAIGVLKAFAYSRGEALSVDEDSSPDETSSAHMSRGTVCHGIGPQVAAMAAIAKWLDGE